MRPPVIPILRSAAELAASSGSRLFCPALAGFDPNQAEIMSVLPVQDSNSRVLEALRGVTTVPADVAVGVLAVDPFRPAAPFLSTLRMHGVRHITNFPATALFDGETGEALRGVGLGWEREAEFLERAAGSGFAITAFVGDLAMAQRLQSVGARIVVHPGAASGEGVRDQAAAAAAVALAQAIRRGSDPVLIHVPAGFSASIPLFADAADALVMLPHQSSRL